MSKKSSSLIRRDESWLIRVREVEVGAQEEVGAGVMVVAEGGVGVEAVVVVEAEEVGAGVGDVVRLWVLKQQLGNKI